MQKKKKTFFFSVIFLKIFLLQKKAINVVLPIEEISLRPELSSPAHFRIQVGYRQRDGEGQRSLDGQIDVNPCV